MAADWVDDAIAHQIKMNARTWATLQSYGVGETTEITLDFFYDAPSEHSAWELAAFLRQETDYEVRVTKDGVKGSTQPTLVSLEILNQWVSWMISAGAEHGE